MYNELTRGVNEQLRMLDTKNSAVLADFRLYRFSMLTLVAAGLAP